MNVVFFFIYYCFLIFYVDKWYKKSIVYHILIELNKIINGSNLPMRIIFPPNLNLLYILQQPLKQTLLIFHHSFPPFILLFLRNMLIRVTFTKILIHTFSNNRHRILQFGGLLRLFLFFLYFLMYCCQMPIM